MRLRMSHFQAWKAARARQTRCWERTGSKGGTKNHWQWQCMARLPLQCMCIKKYLSLMYLSLMSANLALGLKGLLRQTCRALFRMLCRASTNSSLAHPPLALQASPLPHPYPTTDASFSPHPCLTPASPLHHPCITPASHLPHQQCFLLADASFRPHPC